MSRRLPFSRRSFLRMSAVASAATAVHLVSEPMLAAAQREAAPSAGMVMIDQNENPLGPSQAAREAATAIIPHSWRYSDNLTEGLVVLFAEQQGVKTDYVRIFPGSTPPIHGAVMAYTSAQRSYVTADPGYEAGMFSAPITGARIVKVPLTKTYAHDAKAMLAAAPDAGLFYVCSPNNPTGTLTPLSEIEYLVANKPKGSVVVVDEAYIHFSKASTAMELVKADKEIVVLRTFSKLYGLAGLRCGFAVGRPDLLEPITNHLGFNFMPVPAIVAATASLKDSQLIGERREINASIRQETFDWLDRNKYTYIPSESNCFLLDTKRPGKETIKAMAQQNVVIGRVWPVLPNWVRITVGTREEMAKFREAFRRVMSGAVAMSLPAVRARVRVGGGVLVS